jgi:hypothetical protein
MSEKFGNTKQASASLVPHHGTATDHKQTKNEQRGFETGLSVSRIGAMNRQKKKKKLKK